VSLKPFVITAAAVGVAAAAHAATLAVVNGEKITTADIVAAEGKTPTGDALNQAVDRFIERKLLAGRARAEGVDVPPALLARGYELAHRAWGPNRLTDDAAFRRYLNEEILIRKYMDLYIFPQLNPDEETLQRYFVDHATQFLKKPPADRAARLALFPPRQYEVLYQYLREEMARRLAEEVAVARASATIEKYTAGP
jgi:hypothetical protein